MPAEHNPTPHPTPHPTPQARARRLRTRFALPLAMATAALLVACGGGAADDGSPNRAAALSATAALGERIFKDGSLSASGTQSCASCHAASAGHAAPNALAAQFGGAGLNLQGGRLAPTLRYLERNTSFGFDAEGTPRGGFFWDGRATSLMEQAGKPFFNPVEMANTSVAELVGRLQAAEYAAEFQALFGADIWAQPEQALHRATLALQQYQLEDAEFHPYSSRYDEFLRGRASLSTAELRGLAVFNSPAKGNCAACHPSGPDAQGRPPLFTDFSYDNLGLPRNAELAANADPAFFDLGLCQQSGGALEARRDLCGAFKVPTLRNVAVRQALFHNGVFKDLAEALRFYALRDIEPQRFYPRDAAGQVMRFEDLPTAYRANVNTTEAPLNRRPGQAPALSEADISDLLAFLNTLTDADVAAAAAAGRSSPR